MNWIAACGLALLPVAIGILAWVAWGEDIEKEIPASGEPALLKSRILESRRRRELRNKRWAFTSGAVLLLASIFLILQSQHPVSTPQNIQVTITPPGPPPVPVVMSPNTEIVPSVRLMEPSFFVPGLFIVLLFVLGIVLIFKHSNRARVAGASLLVFATTSSQFHLIRELKFEVSPKVTVSSLPMTEDGVRDLVNKKITEVKTSIIKELRAEIESLIGKIEINIDSQIAEAWATFIDELNLQMEALVADLETKVDEVTLRAKIDAYLQELGAPGSEHLGDFVGFDSGKPDFKEIWEQSVSKICKRWDNRTSYQTGLLLVVGATDRIPLGPTARQRYESNVGLARARAEEIKTKIEKCGVPADRILAIVSGPRTTLEQKQGSIPKDSKDGYVEDRMVDVWAIWGWRDRH